MTKLNELGDKLREAFTSGRYCLCVFHVDAAGTIHLYRQSTNFPTSDLERAVNLLSDDLVKQADFDLLAGMEDLLNADQPAVRPRTEPGLSGLGARRLANESALRVLPPGTNLKPGG